MQRALGKPAPSARGVRTKAMVCATGTLLVAQAALAEPLPGVGLAVSAAPGAGDCPTRDAVEGAVAAQGLDRSADAEATFVSVRFEPSGEGRAATIVVAGPRGGERHLVADGPGCGALAASLAVSLAIMLDAHGRGEMIGRDPGSQAASGAPAEAAEPTAPTVPPAPPAPAPPRPAASRPVPGPTAPPRLALRLHGGLAATYGMARDVSGAGLLGASLRLERFSVALRWFSVPSVTLPRGPGTVEIRLRGGSAAACGRFVGAETTLHADACAALAAAVLSGEGRGYTQLDESSAPWLAVGPALELEWPVSSHVAWAASAAGLASVLPHRFEVDYLGLAFQTRPVAVLLGTELRVRVW